MPRKQPEQSEKPELKLTVLQKWLIVVVTLIVLGLGFTLTAHAMGEETVGQPETEVLEEPVPEDEHGIRSRLSSAWKFVVDGDASTIVEEYDDRRAEVLADLERVVSERDQEREAATERETELRSRIRALQLCVAEAVKEE